ncbi:hypothetical protein OEA41_005863 [Lepraria neglecta]|uniref:Uncharacterized protein n=1 Tax=Lepraria neglecta TaxID=209136 RepID=A0AAE0DK37_9LECA|nr:hypothetical protein OEA41_005863 [Lepraria neglecta]
MVLPLLFGPNTRIQKRPILHPSIPSPYTSASQQKILYISPRTPFISAVKRVRKLLSLVDERATPKISLVNSKMSDRQKLRMLSERSNSVDGKGKGREEVVLKATNRAIENVLGLALYFQGQDDCTVRLRTGSVGVVDDVVERDGLVDGEGEGEEEEEELPESRVRKCSVVEVAITLK